MFKALTAAALMVASLGVGAAPERQVTLTTGVMQVPVHLDAYRQCDALNVSAAPLVVTIEHVDCNGLVEVTDTRTLNPGVAVYSYSRQICGRGHCRVSFQAPAGSVRASICNWQNYSCVSHLEAR